MTGQPPVSELSERDRAILRDVIYTFMVTGEPVSSRRMAKQSPEGLSAATVRNTMADLAEQGYLSQPHTSAGRVPTARGYHLFIDSLMTAESVPEHLQRYIDENLMAIPADGERLTAATSQLLSQLSQQVGVVLTPVVGRSVLRRIELVPLDDSKILCVTVSTHGFVDTKVIEAEETIPREELVRLSNYLTDNFAGRTLAEIRDRMLALMDDARSQVDRLLARAIDFARQGLELVQPANVVVDGTEALLRQPELGDLSRVLRLLETFADKARLVDLLNRCLDGPGVRVFIGDDSELTSELDFSLIVTGYDDGRQVVGCLGIFGPSRMEYPRVIPLVDYLGERLSAALAAAK
jgi:heat-inducible transcriptional repressor